MEKIYQIVKNPHSVLRQKASHVAASEITTPKIQELIERMKATLKETSDGVGLAAPQVGKALSIFIVSEEAEEIDRVEKEGWERRRKEDAGMNERPYEKRPWRYYVFINPVVKSKSRAKQDGHEGCLSVPGLFGNVMRQEKIMVQAFDEHGKKFTRGSSHFFARVVQHELDHLDGVLFIDKARSIVNTG